MATSKSTTKTVVVDIGLLRQQLAQLTKEGFKEVPIRDLLLIVASCVTKNEETKPSN